MDKNNFFFHSDMGSKTGFYHCGKAPEPHFAHLKIRPWK